jgi:hypothetical protein
MDVFWFGHSYFNSFCCFPQKNVNNELDWQDGSLVCDLLRALGSPSMNQQDNLWPAALVCLDVDWDLTDVDPRQLVPLLQVGRECCKRNRCSFYSQFFIVVTETQNAITLLSNDDWDLVAHSFVCLGVRFSLLCRS